MVPETLESLSLNELPLVEKRGRKKSCCSPGEGDQSLFILAPPLPSFKALEDPREELYFFPFFFFIKQVQKETKQLFFFGAYRCM